MVDKEEITTQIRNGLFLASSRTYAEQYLEPFIRYEYDLNDPAANDHDATDKRGLHYEIKASKVLRVTANTKKTKSLYERILYENANLETSRLVPFEECKTAKYGANIQNVKRDHFQELIYVLLFEDCVKVFKIESSIIERIPNWSNKHGRYDAPGKSGQFPINMRNIGWHLEHHLADTFTYQNMASVYELLS